MKKRLLATLLALVLLCTLCAPLALADGNSWAAASPWALPELEKADEYGLYPDVLLNADLTKPITRQEFAAVAVALYEKQSGKTVTPSSDTTFTDTTNVAVLKAHAADLVNGTSAGVFSPDKALSRQDAATMLARVYKKIAWEDWTLAGDVSYTKYTLDTANAVKFSDDAQIGSWAHDSVYFMAKYELVKGMGGGQFAPNGTTTREQALAIGLRTFSNWSAFKNGPEKTEAPAKSLLQEIADKAQSELKGMEDIFDGKLSISVTTKGESSLVITYKVLDPSLGMTAEIIEMAMDEMGSAMDGLLVMLKGIGIQNPSIVIHWLDKDGKQLYTKEYK